MKKLPGQKIKPRYYEPVEQQLMAIFYDLLFKPLVKIGNETSAQMSPEAHSLLNAAANPLQAALRSGRVQYEAGVFSGQTNAEIVRVLRVIGAKKDKRSGLYRMEPAQVPAWVKAESASYLRTAQSANKLMRSELDRVQKNLDHLLDKKPIRAHKTIREIQSDFRTVASRLAIRPELSEDSTERLADEYNRNLQLYVKDFSRKMITDLRGIVEANAQEGYRFDKLIGQIKNRYGVTQNKAKFLARQETGLFMSKFRQERFSEAGVTHYIWSTSHDERVRPEAGIRDRANNHRVLDGKVFAYAQPPIVDTATGRRANPGQDFNCRCVDLPVLERVKVPA